MQNRVKEKLNWTYTLFFIITPLVAIVGTVLMAINHMIHWQTIVLAVVFAICTGLAITAGYHRLFAHKTYSASKWFEWILIFFGTAAFEGSILDWSTDHRNHHLYTDTDRDPYNAHRGFWYSHIGWIFLLDESRRDFSNVEDLKQNKLIAFQHKFFTACGIVAGFLIPMALGALWHDALGGLIIAGALRMTIVHHCTFFINSLAHIVGKKTYNDKSTACDNWMIALLTYGEGYHNFHHKFPLDYRNGIKAYHYDPTKWLIRGLSYLGATKDLKRMDSKKIMEYRLRNEEKRLLNFSVSLPEGALPNISQYIEPTKEAVFNALSKLDNLQKAYRELKQKHHMPHMQTLVSDYSKNIVAYQQKIKAAKRELKQSLNAWKHLLAYTNHAAGAAAA